MALKDVEGNTFEGAIDMFEDMVKEVVIKNKELLNSPELNDYDRKILIQYLDKKANIIDLKNSLKLLSRCLYQHGHKKVIVLIDDYDIPLKELIMKVIMMV